MSRGKRLKCPKLIVTYSAQPGFRTKQEAWESIAPVLVEIFTQVCKEKLIKEGAAGNVEAQQAIIVPESER